jgi:hypothetical protein
MLRQLVTTLIVAIMPQPDLDRLQRCRLALRRHLHEPPRKKREYQRMTRLF